MLEAEIIGIEIHLPQTVQRLASNLRLRTGSRLVDESNLAAFARYLKKELRLRFDCKQVAVKYPGAKRKRDLSALPDLTVRVKARPGHAGPVVFDAAAEGEAELFVKEALLRYEDLIRLRRLRIFWLKVAGIAVVVCAAAWGLHKLGLF